MRIVFGLIILLSILSCKKQCSEPILEDFKNIYSDIPKYSAKPIEISSSTGLKENILLKRSTGLASFSKSRCKDRNATYVNLNFTSSIYEFNFELSFQPGYEANVVTLIQKFTEKNSFQSLRFSYNLENEDADFTTWSNLDETSNCVTRKITHEILDSLNTKYITAPKVYHLTLDEFCDIKNPYSIKELFFHETIGLLRFITVENTVWDMKN